MNDPGTACPSVSVVIPSYADPDHLRRLLTSLSRQAFPASRAQIIVVDDGSPVPIPAQILGCAAPIEARLVRHEANRGRAQARNTGLAQAEGEVVVFVDSDMTAAPNLLAAHVSAQSQADRRVVVGDIRFGADVTRTALARYLDGRGVHRLPAGAAVPFKCFVTGNSSVGRGLLRTAGGFDSGFRHYGGEDLELGYRLHLLGAHFRYAADAGTWHHHCRPLGAMCELMYTYGRHSLPRLMRLHPELAPLLRLDFRSGRPSLRRSLLRLALTSPTYRSVRYLCCRREPRWLPAPLLDYLLWASRSRGFLDSAGGDPPA